MGDTVCRYAPPLSMNCPGTALKVPGQETPLQRQIHQIAEVAEIVVPGSALLVVAADPDDNRVGECAVDIGADLRDFRRTLGPA
jgi:hypothetical protein